MKLGLYIIGVPDYQKFMLHEHKKSIVLFVNCLQQIAIKKKKKKRAKKKACPRKKGRKETKTGGTRGKYLNIVIHNILGTDVCIF